MGVGGAGVFDCFVGLGFGVVRGLLRGGFHGLRVCLRVVGFVVCSVWYFA